MVICVVWDGECFGTTATANASAATLEVTVGSTAPRSLLPCVSGSVPVLHSCRLRFFRRRSSIGDQRQSGQVPNTSSRWVLGSNPRVSNASSSDVSRLRSAAEGMKKSSTVPHTVQMVW